MKMKMCEYLNNLVSLDVLSKLSYRKLLFVEFDKQIIYQYEKTLFQRPYYNVYSFKVDKKTNKLLREIIGRRIKGETKVNEYIIYFGILPITLRFIYNDENTIDVKEELQTELFSGKFENYTKKYVTLLFEDVKKVM